MLSEYTNLFFPIEYQKSNKITLKYFQCNLNKWKKWKTNVMFAINVENLKNLKN